MQAASISVQTSQQTPRADQNRSPNAAGPASEARGGVSFRAILTRTLNDLGEAEPASASRRKTASRAPAPANRPGSNRGKALTPPRLDRNDAKSAGVAEAGPRRVSALKPDGPGREAAELSAFQSPGAAFGAAAANRSDPQAGRPVPEKSVKEAAEVKEKSKERGKTPMVRGEDVAPAAAPPVAKPAARPGEAQLSGEDKAAEGPGAGRRRGDRKDVKVSVLDLRMRPDNPELESGGKSGGASEGLSTTRETVQAGGRQAEAPVPTERPSNAKQAQGSGFSDILARHLSNAGAQDIVKAAHIVLRDGDSGMIRLRLEPESLGNVKIELKMTEKNITGRIVVETDEARNAFEKSLGGLRDAFAEGGFETASLEVSVGGGHAEGGGDPADAGESPFFTERLRDFDRSLPAASDAAYGSDGTVNIWA